MLLSAVCCSSQSCSSTKNSRFSVSPGHACAETTSRRKIGFATGVLLDEATFSVAVPFLRSKFHPFFCSLRRTPHRCPERKFRLARELIGSASGSKRSAQQATRVIIWAALAADDCAVAPRVMGFSARQTLALRRDLDSRYIRNRGAHVIDTAQCWSCVS